MGYMWSITIEDYFEIVALAKEHGVKPGERMDKEVEEVMKRKGKKPICKTDKTPKEIAEQFSKDGLKVLHVKNKKEKSDEEKTN